MHNTTVNEWLNNVQSSLAWRMTAVSTTISNQPTIMSAIQSQSSMSVPPWKGPFHGQCGQRHPSKRQLWPWEEWKICVHIHPSTRAHPHTAHSTAHKYIAEEWRGMSVAMPKINVAPKLLLGRKGYCRLQTQFTDIYILHTSIVLICWSSGRNESTMSCHLHVVHTSKQCSFVNYFSPSDTNTRNKHFSFTHIPHAHTHHHHHHSIQWCNIIYCCCCIYTIQIW